MDRRSVLVAAVTLIAGCGARGETEGAAPQTASPTPQGTNTSPTPTADTPTSTESQYRPAKARSGIATARERLNTATSTLETELSRVDYASRSPQFDGEAIRSAVDDARENLRTATGVATPEQVGTVEGLYDYIEFLEALLTVAVTLQDSRAARPSLTAFRDDYDEAAGDLERARSHLRRYRSQREMVQVKLRTAEDKSDDTEAVGLAVARGVLDLLDALVADFERLYAGELEVKQGWDDYETGLDGYAEDRFVAASSFVKSRRHFARASYLFGRGASELPTDTADVDRTIELVGDGSAVGSYTFTVDGELRKMSGNAADSVDGRTATGEVRDGSDRYAFSGSITRFEVGDGVTVYVDGQAVDPAILGGENTPELTNTIVIAGTGSGAEYRFTVSEAIRKNGEQGSINEGDTVDGTTAAGAVGDGKDAYDYAGVITDFRLSGEADVRINGDEIDPTTLAPDPNPNPRRSLVPLFRRLECQSDRYRMAAGRMHHASLLEEHSPDKADSLRDEADGAIGRAESGCGP